MIAGQEDISAGDLLIDDVRVNDVAPKDRDIAMVFQSYALYPHMSVYDNMAFALKLRKMDKAEIDRRGLDCEIEVDGGVSPANAKKLGEAGASILVAGSAVFKAEDPSEVISAMR